LAARRAQSEAAMIPDPHRHRERSEATQGSATFFSVALLDCFAPLAKTEEPAQPPHAAGARTP
jgi:hypothetical protein